MSATLAAALYQEYFGVPESPIKVGARRFPVEEVYLEDIKSRLTLPNKDANNVEALLKECLNMKCIRTPSMSYMEKLYSVVASLATIVGQPGSSVLVFVPGMNDSKSVCSCFDANFSRTRSDNLIPADTYILQLLPSLN